MAGYKSSDIVLYDYVMNIYCCSFCGHWECGCSNKDRNISGFLVWDMEDPVTPRPLIAPLSELAAEVIARHNAEFFSKDQQSVIVLQLTEDSWGQIWTAAKKYNLIGRDESFSRFLCLPDPDPFHSKKTAEPAPKPVSLAPSNPYSLLSDMGDDDDEDSATGEEDEETGDEEQHEVIAQQEVPTSVTLQLTTLDFSRLPHVKEGLIIAAMEHYASTVTSLNFTDCNQINTATAMAIARLFGRSKTLRSLKISGCFKITDAWLTIAEPALTNLEVFHCGYSTKQQHERRHYRIMWEEERMDTEASGPATPKLGNISLVLLAKLAHIKDLNLAGLIFDTKPLAAFFDSAIFLPRLESLEASYASDFNYRKECLFPLDIIRKRCRKLRHLGMAYMRTQEQETTPEELATLALLPELVSWNGKGCLIVEPYEMQDNDELDPEDITGAPRDAPNPLLPLATKPLLHLETESRSRAFYERLASGPAATTLLTIYTLADYPNMGDTFARFENLRKFRAQQISSIHLKQIIKGCEQLQCIEIRGCHGEELWINELVTENVRNFNMRHFSIRYASTAKTEFHWAKIVLLFPRLTSLRLQTRPIDRVDMPTRDERTSAMKLIAANAPHLHKLVLSACQFICDSPEDIAIIQSWRALEKLRVGFTIAGLRLFLSQRHPFAHRLRSLGITFYLDDVPAASPLTIMDSSLPSYFTDASKKHLALFPCLSTLRVNRGAYFATQALWNYLHKICPNIITLVLTGEMSWERRFGEEEGGAALPDNFQEEGLAVENVRRARASFGRLRNIELIDAWKLCFIAIAKGPKSAPGGYFEKKKHFVEELTKNNIRFLNTFEIWDTYRGYGSFNNVQPPWKNQ